MYGCWHEAEIIAAPTAIFKRFGLKKNWRDDRNSSSESKVTAVYEEKYADHENFDNIMRDGGWNLGTNGTPEVRRLITEDRVRPDGRKGRWNPSLLFLVHGLRLFTRGQAQALSINFGANALKRKSSMVWIQSTRNALCTTKHNTHGETGRYGAPGRH